MRITWYGQGCFQIVAKGNEQPQTSIIINPFDEEIELKSPWKKADVLLFTQKGDNNVLKDKQKQTFLIDGPGEYEIKGVFFQGITISSGKGESGKDLSSMIFTIRTEDIQLCYLGPLSLKELTPEQLNDIGDVSVLMVPTGGVSVLDPKQALKIVSQIEPRIVIPMYYQIPGLKKKKETLGDFLKAFGEESVEKQKVLSIKKRDFPKEDGAKVLVLEV